MGSEISPDPSEFALCLRIIFISNWHSIDWELYETFFLSLSAGVWGFEILIPRTPLNFVLALFFLNAVSDLKLLLLGW